MSVPQRVGTGQAVPAPAHQLWSVQPLLGSLPGQAYQGRVAIEVWEGGTELSIAGDRPNLQDRRLLEQAVKALQSQDVLAHLVSLPWENKPSFVQEDSGDRFLGFVVIEMWNDQTIVGVSGTGPVIERARQRIEKHSILR